MNSIKETMKQAGYEYVRNQGHGSHVLRFWNGTCWEYEVWGVNKYPTGYSIIYKNTHLEFCRDYREACTISWGNEEADNHKM